MSDGDPRAVLDPQTIIRGDPFDWTIGPCTRELVDGTVVGVDLTSFGSTWTAHLRRSPGYYATFTAWTIDASHAADSDGGYLILSLTGTQTAALDADDYVTDIQVAGGSLSPLHMFQADIRVVEAVTRV